MGSKHEDEGRILKNQWRMRPRKWGQQGRAYSEGDNTTSVVEEEQEDAKRSS